MLSFSKRAARPISKVMVLLTLTLAVGVLFHSRKANTATGTVAYLGQKLFYDRGGTGSLVILVPGLHRGHGEFDQVKQILGATHDVISWDLLGQGQSSCPDINYNTDTQVEMLGALIAGLNITDKFHLVGYGEGATIAAKYASQNPAKLKSLSLISAMDVEFYDANNQPVSVNTAPLGSPGYFYRRFIPPTAVTEAFGALALVLASSPKSQMVNPPNAIALFGANINGGCYYGGRSHDRNRLNAWFTKKDGMAISTANLPTELLFGDSDQVLDPNYQGAWKTAISNAQTVIVKAGATPPTCGHDLINECATPAATALNAFFTANGG